MRGFVKRDHAYGVTMDLYDLFQNFKILNVDKKSTRINRKAEDAQIGIRAIQEQVNYLSMVCLALCEVLIETGIPKEKILNKIREIDLRDGKIDNKTSTSKKICPGCHRKIAQHRTVCIYCGAQIEKDNVL